MTFSIVARDPVTGALGVATATAGPSVGALVVHGATGTGAIATQAMTNPLFGIRGLDYLRAGMSAAHTLDKLIREDTDSQRRQVMIVDCSGDIAHWTGNLCNGFAACIESEQCVVGGNLLLNEWILPAMLQQYRNIQSFEDRLMSALEAAAAVGGDRRGIKSAALKIWQDREYASIDARVDWSETPLDALREVISQQRAESYADFFAKIPTGMPPD